MLNKVMVIGRLGKPVDLKYSQAGNPIALFVVATDESFTDKSGQKQTTTEWHRVVVYGRVAELCQQYLDKGSLVFVEGKLKTRKWTDNSGQERHSTEIIAERVQFLDRKSERQETERQYSEPASTPAQAKRQFAEMAAYQRQAQNHPDCSYDPDDVPF